jgi:hypothetical protein
MVDSTIDELLTTEMYNPAILPKLEAHLASQVSGAAPYNFLANKTLLKHYQFFPDQCQAPIVADALVLSLMNDPIDFLALTHLTGDKNNNDCATVIALAGLLESCTYDNFWSLTKTSQSVLSKFGPAFNNNCQAMIVKTLSLVYQTAAASAIATSLNLTEAQLAEYAAKTPEIEKVEGGVVYFAKNESNWEKEKVKKQAIAAKSMKGVL